jgi:hypothetical protein
MLTLSGYKASTTSEASFAAISGYKENASGGDERGSLKFYVNNGSTLVDYGTISSTGAWTLGASGGTSTHTLNGNTLTITPGSGNLAHITAGGTNTDLKLSAVGTGGLTYFYNNSVQTGTISAAGAWSLGVNGSISAQMVTVGGTSYDSNTYDSIGISTVNTGTTARATIGGQSGGTQRWRVGSSREANLITGSVANDLCISSNGGTTWFSGNNGTTAHGKMDTNGAWTLGPTTGAALTAYVGSSGATFKYDSSSTYFSLLPGDAGGTVDLKFGANSGAAPNLQIKNDGGTIVGKITDAGAVTFGSIHNVGAGNITSGTYTMSFSNPANLFSTPSSITAFYSRVGDVVTVSGTVSLDPVTDTPASIECSLPVSTTFASADQCCGAAPAGSNWGYISGVSGTSRGKIVFISRNAGAADTFYFTFQYLIV